MRVIGQRKFPGLAVLYLARFGNDPERLVEFVDTLEPGMPKAEKWVLMVSTQFGCPVGCRMCDAGAMGYRGNLSADRVLEQIRYMVERNPDLDIDRHPKVKIHFARMGEPALNPEVLKALRLLAREFPGPGILPSLSTVAPLSPAVAPFFDELLEAKDALFPGGRFQLQFSLHSLDEGKRREIVPIRTWSPEQIAGYGARFVRPGDRKITLNFALAPGETIDAAVLAALFSPERFLIKITPVNPTETANRCGAAYAWTDPPGPIQDCARTLESLGFQVIVSPSLAEEILAETSCGQLWSRTLKDKAAVALKNRQREEASYVTAAGLPGKLSAWKAKLEPCQRRRFPLHPGKAGLLVMDVQDLFLNPTSSAYLPPARAIMANVVRLADSFRKAGRPVYFTFHAHQDPAKDGGLMTRWWRKVCLTGTPEARIPAFLSPDRARVFRKSRYNAFTNPSLEKRLRRDKVEELVIVGVATNLCVESTARSAFDLGFQPFVLLDATAAHTEESHLASLKNMAVGFAAICDTEEILAFMGPAGEKSGPRATL